MRWYRAYVGTVSDPKLYEVAEVAGCKRALALAVWQAILEDAADVHQQGSFTITARRISIALQEPVDAIKEVIDALEELHLIDDGVVVAWTKRQFESDSSAARTRQYRKRHSDSDVTSQVSHGNSDATLHDSSSDVTVTPSDGVVTPPDTDTDTDTESEKIESSLRSDSNLKKNTKKSPKANGGHRSPRQELETVLSADMAEAVIDHRIRIRKPLSLIAATALCVEFAKAGDPNRAALIMIENGWRGFKTEWLHDDRSRH